MALHIPDTHQLQSQTANTPLYFIRTQHICAESQYGKQAHEVLDHHIYTGLEHRYVSYYPTIELVSIAYLSNSWEDQHGPLLHPLNFV
jgi:hypothetical protein